MPPILLLVQEHRIHKHHPTHRRDPAHSTSPELSEEELHGGGPSDGDEMSQEWGGTSEGEDESGVGEDVDEDAPFW
jgi:hypothetical protein